MLKKMIDFSSKILLGSTVIGDQSHRPLLRLAYHTARRVMFWHYTPPTITIIHGIEGVVITEKKGTSLPPTQLRP